MLTVALFSHTPRLCGAERMLLNLALLLRRSETVHPLLLAPGEGDLLAETRRHGLDYEIVPAAPWHLLPPGNMDDYRRGVQECTATMKTILVDLNCDAVLINTMTSVPAMLAAVELDLPSLVWVHGVLDSLLLPGRSSEFAAAHDELLLHSATRVVALPNFTSECCARVMQRRGLDVIPDWTPVDPHFTAPPGKYRSRRFACLNTFDPHKGHATLLKAAALLKAGKAPFDLHLYGDGPVRGEMEARAAALGLQECVRFHGRTADVGRVYDEALCVVNPADVEPFGMTLIEAMARKTPVLATRCGGPSEIVVDGQCGYLVDRGDAAAMAARMQSLLESPEAAQRLGEEGFRRVCAHYGEETARAAFLPVIEAAVGGFGGYDPAVKTLTKIYRLWLEQTAGAPAPWALVGLSAAGSARGAAGLARKGLRRTKALARSVLAAFGLCGAAVSPDGSLKQGSPGDGRD